MDQAAQHSPQSPSGTDGDPPRDAVEAPPALWEWVVAALGLLLVVASMTVLLHEAWTSPSLPPQPQIRVLGIEPRRDQAGFLVRLQVHNRSGATAANLRIEGELKQGDEVLERSETEFQYLPGRSSREAGLFFTRDPRALRLELSARSFQKP
jgi:uncharacterized protein (TIGR02588 family)